MKVSPIALLALTGTSALATAISAIPKISSAILPTVTGSVSSSATDSHASSSHGKSSKIQAIIGTYTPTAVKQSFVNQPTGYIHFDCDTHAATHASDHFLNTIGKLHDEENRNHSGSPAAHGALFARGASKININLYVHVVLTNANKNMVTKQMVTDQAAELNTAYAPLNISFTLKGTDFSVNDAWSLGSSDADDLAMKKALRNGTYADLNLYFHSDMAGGVLGKCTLPSTVQKGAQPSIYAIDGCNIAAGTMPGGPITDYNQGKTAVHETGHWLGLLHTFDGYSCSGPGDYVSDTPAESVSTDGCPTSPAKDSCAGQRSGTDPIHNYMDYSTDSCYTGFSSGQQARIRTLWTQYRDGM